jgi:hypothetical protein
MENNYSVAELVANARSKVVAQYESTYGANVTYAQTLNEQWAEFDWFDLKHNDTSAEGKAVKAEGDLFRKGIKDWHSNPSVAWKQIRDHARADRYGKPVMGSEVSETESETESEGAKHNRSPELRNLEELVTLYKFNRRQEGLSTKLQKVQGFISSALIEMGVDLNMIED